MNALASWGSGEWWILATSVCCAVACALVGAFLVLRRMSLLADAISHAILPGLVLAFLLTGTRSTGAMLLGAAGAGVLTGLLSSALNRVGRVGEDAALGVVFSTLFAVGVVLISFFARDVDLDPGCVLYGLLEFTPLHTVQLLGVELPRSFLVLACAGLVNLALVTIFFKELRLVCFDAALATTMGFSAAVVHHALMGLVAATAVASFEAVGSVLVVAMLVAPAATAHLLTDRLDRLVVLAGVIAAASAAIGTVVSVALNITTAGTIAATTGAVFFICVLVAPRHGVAAKWLRRWRLSVRIAGEDLLAEMYRAGERAGAPAAAPAPDGARARAAGGDRTMRWAVLWLRRSGLLTLTGAGTMELTDGGRERARSIIRSHRLWESYLHAHTPLPLDHLHEPSHRVEHFVGPELQRALEKELGCDVPGEGPAADPHGAPIPPREGP